MLQTCENNVRTIALLAHANPQHRYHDLYDLFMEWAKAIGKPISMSFWWIVSLVVDESHEDNPLEMQFLIYLRDTQETEQN